jgi:hypothetical protein
MIRRTVGVLATLVATACTEPVTDPNAVVAVRMDGSGYKSIVGGDSLRDSLGLVARVRVTPLNYKNEPVDDAPIVFASPDTILLVNDGGGVFAKGVRTDAAASLIYASVGALQTTPDTVFTVVRADSIKAERDVQAMNVTSAGGVSLPDSLPFTVLGDTAKVPAADKPRVAIRSWLVSYQLLYKKVLLSPTDTSKAYTFWPTTGTNARRVASFGDTTDQSGRAARGVFVRSITATEDTIFLIATVRQRLAGSKPKSDTTMILLQQR